MNPLTKPFQALKSDDGTLTLYPDKGCAEQLRKLHKVSTQVVGREIIDGLYVVTVRASTPDGRTEEAQGVVPLVKAKGRWEEYDYRGQTRRRFKAEIGSDGQEAMIPLSPTERAAAMMRAETKSKRRVTLAICGLGMADWDQEPESPSHPQALTLAPARPDEAAKDLQTHITDLFGESPPAAEQPPALHPIWQQIAQWYTEAGREAQYPEFQQWCLRRYQIRSLDQMREADLEEIAKQVWVTLEPLIQERQRQQGGDAPQRAEGEETATRPQPTWQEGDPDLFKAMEEGRGEDTSD